MSSDQSSKLLGVGGLAPFYYSTMDKPNTRDPDALLEYIAYLEALIEEHEQTE